MRTRSYDTMSHYKKTSTQQIGLVRSKTNQISTIIKDETNVKRFERVLGERGMDYSDNKEYREKRGGDDTKRWGNIKWNTNKKEEKQKRTVYYVLESERN